VLYLNLLVLAFGAAQASHASAAEAKSES